MCVENTLETVITPPPSICSLLIGRLTETHANGRSSWGRWERKLTNASTVVTLSAALAPTSRANIRNKHQDMLDGSGGQIGAEGRTSSPATGSSAQAPFRGSMDFPQEHLDLFVTDTISCRKNRSKSCGKMHCLKQNCPPSKQII